MQSCLSHGRNFISSSRTSSFSFMSTHSCHFYFQIPNPVCPSELGNAWESRARLKGPWCNSAPQCNNVCLPACLYGALLSVHPLAVVIESTHGWNFISNARIFNFKFSFPHSVKIHFQFSSSHFQIPVSRSQSNSFPIPKSKKSTKAEVQICIKEIPRAIHEGKAMSAQANVASNVCYRRAAVERKNGEQKFKILFEKNQAFVNENSRDHQEGSSHRIFRTFSSTESQHYTLRQGVDRTKRTGNVEEVVCRF